MLTKLQRYTAYVIMAHEAEQVIVGKETGNYYRHFGGMMMVGGLCDLLESILFSYNKNIFLKYGLTELSQRKPASPFNRYYWFSNDIDGWKKRIELLKQCIEETSPDK